MSISDAFTLSRARELLGERRQLDVHLGDARGVYRERLVARRKAVVAMLRGVPAWALEIASGQALREALEKAAEQPGSAGSARLIRWAEDRYGVVAIARRLEAQVRP